MHSGDLVHANENGFFFIVDRLKELIKYKGYQIAPAELEDLILKHQSVADVAVIGGRYAHLIFHMQLKSVFIMLITWKSS